MDGGLSRREFLKIGATGMLGLYVGSRLDGFTPVAYAASGALLPADIPKYLTPLLIPPVMPRAAIYKGKRGKPVDYYEISMKQFEEQILPAGLPKTTVWGYGAVSAMDRRGLLLHHAPSLTIEAEVGRPVRVKWINDLKDGQGNYLPHLLPVDQTLHWANPPAAPMGATRDRPSPRPRGPTPVRCPS